MGLTSRSGVAPLNLLADIAGPITRTVEDAVAVFAAIVGPDPADPVTVAESPIARDFSPGGRPTEKLPDYSAALKKDALKGARVGVLRQAYERDTTDSEIVKVFTAALGDMKRAGATIVDPVRVEIDQIRRQQSAGTCGGFKYDINRYLAAQGDRVPVHTLEEIISRDVSIRRCSSACSRHRTDPRTVPTPQRARPNPFIASRCGPPY